MEQNTHNKQPEVTANGQVKPPTETKDAISHPIDRRVGEFLSYPAVKEYLRILIH